MKTEWTESRRMFDDGFLFKPLHFFKFCVNVFDHFSLIWKPIKPTVFYHKCQLMENVTTLRCRVSAWRSFKCIEMSERRRGNRERRLTPVSFDVTQDGKCDWWRWLIFTGPDHWPETTSCFQLGADSVSHAEQRRAGRASAPVKLTTARHPCAPAAHGRSTGFELQMSPFFFSNCFRCLICRKIRALALPTQLHPMWPLSPFFFWRLWILGSSRTLPYWRFLGGKLHRWADCRLNSLKSNMSCTSNFQKTQQPVNLCLFTAYLSALQPWCWGTNQTRSSQTWLRSFWFLPQQHRVSVTETQHLTPPQNK